MEALREWLVAPGAGPSTEDEALLKVFYANFGDREALDDHLAAHRVCRHIEAKVAKRITAAQKRRWRKHSRLPDTPAEEDRVAIVFRRMPKGETALFDAAGKRKE